MAIVPFNPRGLERRPSTWPGFPWAQLAEVADAFAPMVYTGAGFGFDATYGYVTRALRLLRLQTGNPDVAIHVAGGVADPPRPGGARRVRRRRVRRQQGHRREPVRLGDDASACLAGARAARRLVDTPTYVVNG